jgi:hypothetical protein
MRCQRKSPWWQGGPNWRECLISKLAGSPFPDQGECFDPEAAEAVGAFVEDALEAEDARESVYDGESDPED